MPDDSFDVNLLRWISAQLYFSLGMQAAREMYGKSFFALGEGERVAVNNAVGVAVRANYQAMTPDLLTVQETPKGQPQKPIVGFQPQSPTPKSSP